MRARPACCCRTCSRPRASSRWSWRRARRQYVASRIRAGILEQSTVDLLRATGLGERLDAEGHQHRGIYLQWPGERHHLDFVDLTGRSVWVYGQTEVQKDLVAARTAAGQQVFYEVADTALHDLSSDRPSVTFTSPSGSSVRVVADAIAGCDGSFGPSRGAVPEPVRQSWERLYPYSWLGILANVAPSTDELIYAWHPDGFALHSMRSDTVSRFYVQVPNDTPIGEWSDDRIWEALATRLGHGQDGWSLETGPVTSRAVLPMRSFVATPMRHGRLFLAGDAAHIVPPTGAKGLNLAVADVALLAPALAGLRPGLVRAGGRLLRHRPAPRLALHPLLLVDDLHAPHLRRPVRRRAPAVPAPLGLLLRRRRHRAGRELRRAADRLLTWPAVHRTCASRSVKRVSGTRPDIVSGRR